MKNLVKKIILVVFMMSIIAAQYNYKQNQATNIQLFEWR